ncbi:MAG: hypothetical protein GF364_10825 [Candidatus Lokiarchaeota archaeon]|nr:hypothetical protein [Candidatus Lokiarchaeota archaeon]
MKIGGLKYLSATQWRILKGCKLKKLRKVGGCKLDSTFKKYQEIKLTSAEHAAMLELKSLVEEAILKVSGVSYDTFGFTTSDKHVTQLGIYRKGLSSLPERIRKELLKYKRKK